MRTMNGGKLTGVTSLLVMMCLLLGAGSRAQACIPTPEPTPVPVIADSQYAGQADAWSRPLAPAALTVEPGSADPATQLLVRWTDRSQRETGYRVERSYNGGASWEALPALVAGTTSTLDTGLVSGVLVGYRVRALIANAVESLPTTVSSCRTAPHSPGASLSGTGGLLNEIRWDAVAGAMGYDIYMLDDYGNWILVASGVTGLSWIDRASGLGRAQGWRVVARMPNGATSQASVTVSPPLNLLKLKNEQTSTVCLITEVGRLIHTGSVHEAKSQQELDALGGISGMKLWRVGGRSGQTLAAVVLTRGASGYQEGDVLLRGRLCVDESANRPSPTDPFTLRRAVPVTSASSAAVVASVDLAGNLKLFGYEGWGPCNLTATAQANDSIRLDWDDYTSQTASTSVFRVERSRSADFTTSVTVITPPITAQGTRFIGTDTGLPSGTQYYYRVSRELRGRRWSSNVADTWTHPPAPRFKLIAAVGNQAIMMAWAGVTSAGVSAYRLYRATSEAQLGNPALPSTTVSGTFFTDDGGIFGPLSGDTTYWYMVKAINPGGMSDTGDTTSTATLPTPVLRVSANVPVNESARVTIYDGTGRVLGDGNTDFDWPLELEKEIILETQTTLNGKIVSGWLLDGQRASYDRYLKLTPREFKRCEARALYTDFGLLYTIPAAEDAGIDRASTIRTVFNNTVSTALMWVYGSASGHTPGSVSLSGEQAIFSPTSAWRAGELIEATLTTATQGATSHLLRPFVWRLTARVADAGQPTSYSLARAFALGADAQSSASCLAAVNLFSTTTLQTAVGVWGGQNRIEFHDLASSACLSRTLDELMENPPASPTLDHTTAIAVADLNPLDSNSATADLVVANDGGPSYVYLSGQGDQRTFRFLQRIPFTEDEPAQAVAVGDLNGDGFQDVVLGNRSQVGSVYFNDGYGHLSPQGGFGGKANVTAVAIADMNQDGSLDIIAGCYGSGQNRIYLNDGTGHFSDDASTTRSVAFGPNPPMTTSLAVVDLDDQHNYPQPDIILGSDSQLSKVYINKGGLRFEEVGLTDDAGTETRWPVRAVAAADFNADGLIDVALGNADGNPAVIYLNQSFTAASSAYPGTFNRVFRRRLTLGATGTEVFNARALAAADYDGDGDIDLALAQQGAPGQIFLRGEPAPTPAQSIFKVPAASDNLCYAYDWAVDLPGYNFLDSPLQRLGYWFDKKEPNYWAVDDLTSVQFDDDMPALATDNKGHWVMAWSTNNNLNYTTSTNTDPVLKNFDLQDDSDIVVSRFWDKRGTVENAFDPEHKDVWSSITMDQDVLWTPPVPVDEVEAKIDRPKNMDFSQPEAYGVKPFQDKAPSLATDGHGNWAVVWVAYDVITYFPAGWEYLQKPSNYSRLRNPVVKMSVSHDDAKTWAPGFVVRDLNMSPYEGYAIAPKIACDQTSPTSTWIVTYPAANSANRYAWLTTYPNIPWGQHRSYDTDIYISVTSTTLQGGKFVWPANPAALTTRTLNANSQMVAVGTAGTAQRRDIGDGNMHYYGYADGDWIDDPYDSSDPGLDSCQKNQQENYLNGDCMSRADDGIDYHLGSCGASQPLDLATDGHGHWMAVWVSSVHSLKTARLGVQTLIGDSGDTEILFSFSSNGGKSWTYPSYVNSTAISDNASHAYDGHPTVATVGGKWIVLWETWNTDPSQFDCPSVQGQGSLVGWGKIACAVATTDELCAAYNDDDFWVRRPWSKAKILNPDARQCINAAPRLCAMGNGDWMATWVRQTGKTVTMFALSKDSGATWNCSEKNMLFSEAIPPQSNNGQQAIAGDATGNAIVAWAATSGVNQNWIPKDIGDWDIVTARTGGLLTADHLPVAIRPQPTPTPTPPPVAVSDDLTNMPPAKVSNIAGLPESLATSAARYVCPFVPLTAPLTESANDTTALGSAMIFHMPLLGQDPSVQRVSDIRQVDLSFKAGRTTPAQYRVFVFKAGRFGADQWADPAAWEEVLAPTGTGMTWAGTAERALALTSNFERYLAPAPAQTSPLQFGPAGKSVTLTTGTLTWAVYSLPADSITPGQLHFEDAKAVVWPTVRPPARPPFADDLTLTSPLTLWARVEAAQAVPPCNCGTNGEARFSLEADPATGVLSGKLAWRVSLKQAQPGMVVRLRGFARRGVHPNPQASNTWIKTLCTVTSTGAWSAAGTWDFLHEAPFNGNAAKAGEFAGNLIGRLDEPTTSPLVFLDLGVPSSDPNPPSLARGQIEPDRDDDGATDREEYAIYKTNPLDRDTDDDGLLDGEEARALGLLAWTKKTDSWSLEKVGANPLKVDTDGDGLADSLEAGMTTATLEGRILSTPWTKNLSWTWGAGGSESHAILATTPTLAGGVHKASGMHLIDADPATVTNPQKPDTDKDGFWDGPTVWEDLGKEGLLLRKGEDKNGNGRIEPAGHDGTWDTLDDEFDPNNPVSHFDGNPILALDMNRNHIPDSFEDAAAQLGQAASDFYGEDPDDVAASVIADAQATFGSTQGSGSSGNTNTLYKTLMHKSAATTHHKKLLSADPSYALDDDTDLDLQLFEIRTAEAVCGDFTYLGLLAALFFEYDQMYQMLGEGMRPRSIIGRAITNYLNEIQYFRLITDNDLQTTAGTGGETMMLNESPNPKLSNYHGTFINGQLQSKTAVTSVTINLSRAYGIPVMYSLNPTQGTLGTDLVQSAAQTGYIALPYLKQYFNQHYGTSLSVKVSTASYQGYIIREKSVQSLVQEWERIWNLNENSRIVHFAYSQGNIISRMALDLFTTRHLGEVSKRMQMVVMGSGYAWWKRGFVPDDTHFVYNKHDPVYLSVGGLNLISKNNEDREKWSVITGYNTNYDDGLIAKLIGPHVHLEVVDMPNTYSWWYNYVGGPIFQISNGSIDAEKWWLHNKQPRDWWNAYDVTATAEFPSDTVIQGNARLEHVLCEFNPPDPSNSDFVTFNPTQALRDQQAQQQP